MTDTPNLYGFATKELPQDATIAKMKLHRNPEIIQESTWHLAHRIRKSYEGACASFAAPAVSRDTYIGRKELNKHASKRQWTDMGTAIGETAVVDAKDPETGGIGVDAEIVAAVDSNTLKHSICGRERKLPWVCTDNVNAYQVL